MDIIYRWIQYVDIYIYVIICDYMWCYMWYSIDTDTDTI